MSHQIQFGLTRHGQHRSVAVHPNLVQDVYFVVDTLVYGHSAERDGAGDGADQGEGQQRADGPADDGADGAEVFRVPAREGVAEHGPEDRGATHVTSAQRVSTASKRAITAPPPPMP